MSNEQKITELQERIGLLEMEKQKLMDQLGALDSAYQSFKKAYGTSMEDATLRLYSLSASIESLRKELDLLKEEEPVTVSSYEKVENEQLPAMDVVVDEEVVVEPEKAQETVELPEPEKIIESVEAIEQEQVPEIVEVAQPQQKEEPKAQRPVVEVMPEEETVFDKLRKNVDWEKFVGENLISKLGILIILIGVAIGGKYAIEHQMVSPTMRIVIGLLFGGAMQGVAYKLKSQYKNLSAILASGSVAILYFMTFFAYHLYGLIPMPVAFGAMTLITVATVWLACSYDMEIIAIIGLVGAYVIPFALSSGEGGSPWVLFSYIAIINVGVMVISVKRYWKKLFVSAFAATWLIVVSVYRLGEWTSNPDSWKMLMVLFVTFATFYVTFLAYKVRRSLIFQHFDIHFLLSNSFLFFGLGYNVMYNNASMASHVGWFTFLNAILHAGVAAVLLKKDMVDKSVSRLIIGLAISFLTIALMVWLTGHWLTMFWMLEATVLFIVSRLYHRSFYEKMSYPIFFLALISLIIDWGNPNADHLQFLTPLFDAFSHYRSMWDVSTSTIQGNTLSVVNTVVFVLLCVLVDFINHRYPMPEDEKTRNSWLQLASRCLTAMAIFVVTTAILVHFNQPWITVLWAAEAVVLCYLGRGNKDSMVENGSYCLIALTTISFLYVWAAHSEYSFIDRFEKFSHSFSMSLRGMWKSLVAGSALVTALVGDIWMIYKYKTSTEETVEAFDVDFALKRTLVAVLAFLIWTHTPWVITTILYFALALGCLIWTLYYDIEQKPVYIVVLLLAFMCWLMDICSGIDHNGEVVLLVGTFICTAFVYYMRFFNMKEEFANAKVWDMPFPAIMEVMPFVALGVIVFNEANEWLFCFALAYFVIWTILSLKRRWGEFKEFSSGCLSLLVVGRVIVKAFDLQIENIPADFDLCHIVSLLLTIGSLFVLYLYKKDSKRLLQLTEQQTTVAFDTSLFVGSIVIVGNELNNICRLLGNPGSFGLVFSVFLGIVSLFGIYYGLYKDKKYLRIEGIVLLAFTILKLFLHDMKRFDTIYKTVAFVSLGLFMLVISFFYQKIAKEKEKANAQAKLEEEPDVVHETMEEKKEE